MTLTRKQAAIASARKKKTWKEKLAESPAPAVEDKPDPEPKGLELLPLVHFAAAVDEDLDEPWHLLPFVESWERSETEPVREMHSTGRQHGKSTLARSGISRRMLRNRKLHVGLVSNAAHLSQLHSMAIKSIYTRCGGRLSHDLDTRSHWMTSEGGSLLATSVEGQLAGHRFDLILCDDLYKNRAEAENAQTREHVDAFFKGVLMPALWPGGSIIVVSSRWHIDDQTGRLAARGWREIELPVVIDEGTDHERALWPERKPMAFLETLRNPKSPDYVGDYEWKSQFMCRPGAHEGNPFRGCSFFSREPEFQRIAIGVDLAFSKSARSDWSAIVVLAFDELQSDYRVLEVHRVQLSLAGVEALLARIATTYRGATMAAYVSGPERGVFEELARRGLEVALLPARWAKITRAMRCSEAWSRGAIHVRQGAPWAGSFVAEVTGFTGADEDRDDQVDALVAAFDVLASYSFGSMPMAVGSRCM